MFVRFICDFVYHQDHRIEMTEVIVTDRWEAYEWLEETFLELHRERSAAPDLLLGLHFASSGKALAI